MIDVVVLTKNSGKTLEKSLLSIYKSVPVNKLIAIDGYSTDKTVEILKQYNATIIQTHGTRGFARQIGINTVTTDWFAFVDSDVVLCDNWFEQMKTFMLPQVGAVFGLDLPRPLSGLKLRFMQISSAKVFKVRGGCHDILIQKKAISGIKIPEKLHTLEDAFIKEWIEKFWRIVVNHKAYCYHFKEKSSFLSKENFVSTVKEFRRFRLVKDRLIFGLVFGIVSVLDNVGIVKRVEKNICIIAGHGKQLEQFGQIFCLQIIRRTII
jgi:glycosyltransferase involved in cell wall biosynthesis